jgi:hypothetical protein
MGRMMWVWSYRNSAAKTRLAVVISIPCRATWFVSWLQDRCSYRHRVATVKLHAHVCSAVQHAYFWLRFKTNATLLNSCTGLVRARALYPSLTRRTKGNYRSRFVKMSMACTCQWRDVNTRWGIVEPASSLRGDISCSLYALTRLSVTSVLQAAPSSFLYSSDSECFAFSVTYFVTMAVLLCRSKS